MRATFKNSKIIARLKQLKFNESGNIAFTAAIAMMPVMLILGAAVDYENAVNTKVGLQSAVDSAALHAATLGNGSTNTELTDKSKTFFNSNFKSNGGMGTVAYAAVGLGDSVKVTASVPVDNPFMKLVGYPTTTVGATATVKKSGINLEVSMVLDNTGSMGWTNGATGNTAIFDLKAAATKFVDQVMPTTQGDFYTKIAAIPYNVGVNTGSSAAAVIARGAILPGTSTVPGYQNFKFLSSQVDSLKWDGSWKYCTEHDADNRCITTASITNCVTERTGAQAFTDASPVLYPLGDQYVVGGANGSNGCTVTQYRPLSTSKTDLKATIADMSAANNTVGQVGIGWGWYTLSPNFGLFSGESVPAGYDKLTTTNIMAKVKKIMILMTDGEYNSAYADGVMSGKLNYVNYTDTRVINKDPDNGDPFTQSKAMCSAIKASGVELYVITFQLDKTKPERVDLTTSCAQDSKHLIDADATSLDLAFSTIANQIQAMRIAE